MRTKVNWAAANALVDSYKDKLEHAAMPKTFGSSWMRSEMERVGLVEKREQIQFSEFWAIWFCCIIITRRISEIAALERKTVAKNGHTCARTIKRCTHNDFKHTATWDTESASVLRRLLFDMPWKS